MKTFSGIYNSNHSLCPQTAPCLYLGRHRLGGEGVARAEGIAALASGRIRNAEALRRELTPDRRAPGASDLLLAAYRRWGVDCSLHLEGPCALVVLDQGENRLLLSRDRMGEVPLFYARRGGALCFATHPEALLAMGIEPVVDEDGLRELFGLGPARTPGRTPFREIRSLPPGHCLTADGEGVHVSEYFRLTAQPHADSPERTRETVRALLEQAVRDVVPLDPASMLSGGVDSTALTALYAVLSGHAPETYSIDYEDNGSFFQGGSYQPEQDAPYADLAVAHIGTRHQKVLLTVEELTDALEGAMAARGFPGMADIDSSLYLFARVIARKHRCVLSGECGDEVFGGYPWFHREALIDSDCFPWSGSLALRESILRPEVAGRLRLTDYVRDTYASACAAQPRLPGEDARGARLRELAGLCFQFFMANLQERASCMCSAFGLDVITPFCDERLVQYVYNVPWQLKNAQGVEKGLLRAAVMDLLPVKLAMRRKSPFPKTYHPRYAQLVRERLGAILARPDSPLMQLVDRAALTRLMESDLSPLETPWFGQLMAGPQMLAYLIQVNQWMVRYQVRLQ